MDENDNIETLSAQNADVSKDSEINRQTVGQRISILVLLILVIAVVSLGWLGYFTYKNFVAKKPINPNLTNTETSSSISLMPCTFPTSTPKHYLSKKFLDSLSFFNRNYSKDSQCVYYYEPLAYPSPFFYAIKQADTVTFSPFNPLYARDKNRVYYGFEIISDANPQSFETNGEYGKDNSGLYYNTTKIESGGKNDFELLGSNFAKSVNNMALDH